MKMIFDAPVFKVVFAVTFCTALFALPALKFLRIMDKKEKENGQQTRI